MKSKNKSTGKGSTFPKSFETPAAPQKFADRNLAAINPLKEQFEPTEGLPIRQHHRMAGGG